MDKTALDKVIEGLQELATAFAAFLGLRTIFLTETGEVEK